VSNTCWSSIIPRRLFTVWQAHEVHTLISHSFSVPWHNLSFRSRAFCISALKIWIPYHLTCCSLKHSSFICYSQTQYFQSAYPTTSTISLSSGEGSHWPSPRTSPPRSAFSLEVGPSGLRSAHPTQIPGYTTGSEANLGMQSPGRVREKAQQILCLKSHSRMHISPFIPYISQHL